MQPPTELIFLLIQIKVIYIQLSKQFACHFIMWHGFFLETTQIFTGKYFRIVPSNVVATSQLWLYLN